MVTIARMEDVTLSEARVVIDRHKVLVTDMAWTSKKGKREWGWLSARLSVQFSDEFEVSDKVWVVCQWRERAKAVPEHWTFSLFCREARIYAIDVQPAHLHENKVKGHPYSGQEIGGIHEHFWTSEGYGYAEPISVPLDRPDVIWEMFLKRANFAQCDFSHPDQNQPKLEI